MKTTVDLLLHPVRLRIVQALLGDRRMTTAALAAELSDVSTATLYRHVGTLTEAGVLEVVEEQRVRGAVERTYALRLPAAQIAEEDLAAMSPEDHRRAFMAFTAGLLADFDRYTGRGDVDLRRDGVGYRQAALWLSDEELAEFAADLRRVVEARLGHGPAEGRVRRLLTTVLMPGVP
ncbi:helix-turn-helix domain-containing protein [Planomonospora sp. ID67723]|uniref:helix-turn-helix domain-containing protein n=1 Tax=Planomonospora sp. ID67723 TaxID=2738134 RepID=UPI0018C402F0|nr:helix-turn-helix domain-containing protein [Planomonospora sp. ID67723]MBG0832457.1 helix-turn-helix domain-containing protein [Planomonospora sp. ID67723]